MDLGDPLNLFCSIVFGMIGMGYAMYGKKRDFSFLLSGMILMMYTFVVTSTAGVIWVGLALTAAPFIIRKFM